MKMVSHFQGQDSVFDALYCDEDRFNGSGFGSLEPQFEIREGGFSDHDLSWDDGELAALLLKERTQQVGADGSLKTVRNAGIKWMMRVIGHYGFSAVTAILAVNYFDRFVTSACFQKDKPWPAFRLRIKWRKLKFLTGFTSLIALWIHGLLHHGLTGCFLSSSKVPRCAQPPSIHLILRWTMSSSFCTSMPLITGEELFLATSRGATTMGDALEQAME